jgi:drug/metabolite transporter (DMT)-like permease
MAAIAREQDSLPDISPEIAQANASGRGMAYLALAAAGCTWGTGFYFAKVALTEMGVGHMLLYRFAFGCLGLLPVAFRVRSIPKVPDIPLFLIAAALYIPIQFLVQFEGLARTTVSHASLMVGTLPLTLAIAAVIFTHERLDRVGWSMIALSTIGAILIVLQAHGGNTAAGGPTLIGDLLVLASLFAGVAWVLVTQRVMHAGHGYSPVVMTVYVVFLGTAMLVAWVLFADGPPPIHLSVRVWLALAAQGLLATTAATLLWNWGLRQVPAARAGIFVSFEPVVGSILGVALLNESLGPVTIIGGVLIVGAATVFSLRKPDTQEA